MARERLDISFVGGGGQQGGKGGMLGLVFIGGFVAALVLERVLKAKPQTAAEATAASVQGPTLNGWPYPGSQIEFKPRDYVQRLR